MRIAVNTRFLLPGKLEGIGWFTYETLKRITQQHPEHEFYFLFDRPFDSQFVFGSNVYPVVVPPPARHPLLWYLWFEWMLPAQLKKIKPDIFLSTDGYLSLKLKVPQVIVMHDLAFEHFPDHVATSAKKFYQYYSPRYAVKAKRIATVSDFTRQDIVQRYHISAEKIDVVYNGSNETFRPLSDEEKKVVKGKFTYGENYFIYAGAIQPRKNVANLFRAFDVFKNQSGSNIKLVIAGRRAWQTEEAMQVFEKMQFKNDVVFTGHLERSELSKLMGAATALTYVSLFEGFGIPIVEAMNANVPVITSNVSSMPEVAGEAALLVDPTNVSSIAGAMRSIATDEGLRQKLIEVGKIQCSKFSWQQSADKLWSCLMKAVEEK